MLGEKMMSETLLVCGPHTSNRSGTKNDPISEIGRVDRSRDQGPFIDDSRFVKPTNLVR
jgi:hypothetical protein